MAPSLPVRAHLSARVGNRTFAMDLVLAPGGVQEKQGFHLRAVSAVSTRAQRSAHLIVGSIRLAVRALTNL